MDGEGYFASSMPCVEHTLHLIKQKSKNDTNFNSLSRKEQLEQTKLTVEDVTNIYFGIVAYNLQQLKAFSDKINIFLKANEFKSSDENWLVKYAEDIISIKLEEDDFLEAVLLG